MYLLEYLLQNMSSLQLLNIQTFPNIHSTFMKYSNKLRKRNIDVDRDIYSVFISAIKIQTFSTLEEEVKLFNPLTSMKYIMKYRVGTFRLGGAGAVRIVFQMMTTFNNIFNFL